MLAPYVINDFLHYGLNIVVLLLNKYIVLLLHFPEFLLVSHHPVKIHEKLADFVEHDVVLPLTFFTFQSYTF